MAATSKKTAVLAATVLAVVCISGCGNRPSFTCRDKNPVVNPWTHLRFANNPAEFQFAIVSDRTGGERPGVFARAVDALNLLRPEFVMSIGDLIEGRTGDPEDVKRQRAGFDSMAYRLEMPFFYLAGNHDHESALLREAWGVRLGRPYYHFSYGDVLFLCMNTEDTAVTTVTDAQIGYFEKVLGENPKPRWTFLFMHKPMWREIPEQWAKVLGALGDRAYTVFAGHYHTYLHETIDSHDYIVLSVTGGVSELTGPSAGKFDQVVWVSMAPDGPRVVNLALDGIHDKYVRSSDTTQHAAAAAGEHAQ